MEKQHKIKKSLDESLASLNTFQNNIKSFYHDTCIISDVIWDIVKDEYFVYHVQSLAHNNGFSDVIDRDDNNITQNHTNINIIYDVYIWYALLSLYTNINTIGKYGSNKEMLVAIKEKIKRKKFRKIKKLFPFSNLIKERPYFYEIGYHFYKNFDLMSFNLMVNARYAFENLLTHMKKIIIRDDLKTLEGWRNYDTVILKPHSEMLELLKKEISYNSVEQEKINLYQAKINELKGREKKRLQSYLYSSLGHKRKEIAIIIGSTYKDDDGLANISRYKKEGKELAEKLGLPLFENERGIKIS